MDLTISSKKNQENWNQERSKEGQSCSNIYLYNQLREAQMILFESFALIYFTLGPKRNYSINNTSEQQFQWLVIKFSILE